jgi:hypothetical protein
MSRTVYVEISEIEELSNLLEGDLDELSRSR